MRFIRFPDLVERGIVDTWECLGRLKKRFGFPTGRMIGGKRCWTDAEIEEWLAACPTGPFIRTNRPKYNKPARDAATSTSPEAA